MLEDVASSVGYKMRFEVYYSKNYLFIFGCTESSLLCGSFSSCGKQGLLSRCGARLLIAVTFIAEHRLNNCGTQA